MKADREKSVKRKRHEAEYLIDQLGQESERKAVPLVQEYQKGLEKKEKLEQDLDNEALKKFSRNKMDYQRYLIEILKRYIMSHNPPKKYTYDILSDDDGIVISIIGTDLTSAFKVTGVPKFDIFACLATSQKIMNTIQLLEKNFKSTDSGVLVATPEELKIALKDGKYTKS